MYDYNTTNKSFLELKETLDHKGIENQEYLLLMNENLVGVDPWDENLSEHEKAEIVQECELNIWYFLREVLKMPYDILTHKSSKFGINVGIFSMIYLWINGFNQMTIMPSTMFKTGTICALYVYLRYIFGLSLSNINISSKTPNKAKATKTRISRYKVPDYLKSGIDKGNTEKHILVDEFAYTPENYKIWRRVQNKDNVVLLTTAGDLNTESGRLAFSVKNKAVPWDISYLDKKKEYLEKLYSSSAEPLFNVTFTANELGKMPESLKKDISNTRCIVDRDSLERSVDLIWK